MNMKRFPVIDPIATGKNTVSYTHLAGVSSLIPALNTVTQTTSIAADGL